MNKISIQKAEDPISKVFAIIPGDKIRIQVKFGDRIPDRYRLQILDHRNNSRLNRYGKGTDEGIDLSWPIPRTIRAEHFGVWKIQIDADTESFGQVFYVEHLERIEPPMLFAAPSIAESISEYTAPGVVEEEMATIYQESALQDITSLERASKVTVEPINMSLTPVTTIKGIGKTYADRLVNIHVYSISDFWSYEDRVTLAEIMRVNDSKLSRMLLDAENLLYQKAETMSVPTDKQVGIVTENLLSINGIGQKSVEKLARLGITSISDLIEFEDIEILLKTLRMSVTRLSRVLTSIGKSIIPTEVIQPEKLDPLVQPVTNVRGIGTKTSEKLSQRGILTVQDLLNSSFTSLQDLAGSATLNRWKQNAASYAGQQSDEIISLDETPPKSFELISISGVGLKTAQKLNSAGISTLSDLIESDVVELAEKTHLSEKRLFLWQSYAKKLLK